MRAVPQIQLPLYQCCERLGEAGLLCQMPRAVQALRVSVRLNILNGACLHAPDRYEDAVAVSSPINDRAGTVSPVWRRAWFGNMILELAGFGR